LTQFDKDWVMTINLSQIEARSSLRWQVPAANLVGGFLGLLLRYCVPERTAPTTHEATRIGQPTPGDRNSSNCTGALIPDSGGGQIRLSMTQYCMASRVGPADEKGSGSDAAGVGAVGKETWDEMGEKYAATY
jgi:hypothetical protein